MNDDKAKVDFYEEEDPMIVLPIPYEDEAAEEARKREAEALAKKQWMENLKNNAPAVVPSGFDSNDNDQLNRKKEEAEQAKAAYEAALEKLREAEALKAAHEARVAEASAIKLAAEEAQKAAQKAEVEFDEEGNSIVKIVVPKNYDVVISFRPKKSSK